MDIRSGVDGVVRSNGAFSVACLAVGPMARNTRGSTHIWGTTTAQYGLVDNLFRSPESRLRVLGDPTALACDCSDDWCFLAALKIGTCAAGALPRLEFIRRFPELQHLADELTRSFEIQ